MADNLIKNVNGKNIFTDWFENLLKAVYQMLFIEGHMNVKMLNKVFNGLICDNIF